MAKHLLALLIELLKSGDLPDLAVGGAWACVEKLMHLGSNEIGTTALGLDICGLAMAHLHGLGSIADCVVRLLA